MRPLSRLASFVTWHRRAIAALCAGLAVYLLAQQLSSPARDATPVVVLARDVAAGQPLTAADLELAAQAPGTLPAGVVTTIQDAVGQSAAVPLPRGMPLHSALLAASRTIPPGRALVPVSLDDDRLLAALRPGDRISLVVGGGESIDPVSSDALVAGLPASENSSTLAVGGGRGALVLVDVPEQDAAAVALLGQTGQLGIVLLG